MITSSLCYIITLPLQHYILISSLHLHTNNEFFRRWHTQKEVSGFWNWRVATCEH